MCRKYNIRTVFTTVSTLWKQVTRVKDIDLGKVGVVYKILCEGGQDYIGESRMLGARLKEHQSDQTAMRRG